MISHSTRAVFLSFLFSITLPVIIYGQVTTVDTSFGAVPSTGLTSSNAVAQIVQPDGKVIVWGTKLVADGKAKGDILRLNSNGSLDTSFTYCGCSLTGVSYVLLLPNGKLIAGGSSTDTNTAKMVRLNADGSVDNSFVSGTPPNAFGNSTFDFIAARPDGKLFATRWQTITGFVSVSLYRFNEDGSYDATFTPKTLTSGSPAFASVAGMIFLPDNRYYLAYTTGVTGSSGGVTRYLPDGANDPSWDVPSFATGQPPSVQITSISLESTGSLLVAGRFETVNGVSKPNLIRLQSAGNVDLTFAAQPGLPAYNVRTLASGKILLSKQTDISGIFRIFRLNSDGSADKSFLMDPGVDTDINRFDIDASGNIIFLGSINNERKLVRLLPDGALDSSFAADLAGFGTITAIAQQTNGKVILAGNFKQMNGIGRAGLARVEADGSLDMSFDPGAGFDVAPESLVIQSDGKIYATGDFTTYYGVARPSFVRINTDGSLDVGFAPTVTSVRSVSLQSDGRLVIGGGFSTVNGVGRTGVARLETNGSLDNTFNPIFGGLGIYRVYAQSDGKIMVGGSFTGVNGFNRVNLVRLNSDGTLDQTFNTTINSVRGIWVQPDGKYLTVGPAPDGNIVRKNTDGSNDPSFSSPFFAASSSSDTQIHSVVIRPDGSLLVGGRFDTVGSTPRRNLARLSPTGEFDPLFLLNGANGRVRSLVQLSADKVLAGGDFSKVDLKVQPGISRLSVTVFRGVTPYDFDGDGKADIAVFRPGENKWYIFRSSDSSVAQIVFAIAGDLPAPGDYDGDGKTDPAIFRPSNGDWWYLSSANGAQANIHWGTTGDIPRPSDFDGDGKTDLIVYRPSNNRWYRLGSLGSMQQAEFGLAGDKPLVGDFDGDGKSDLAIYRPSTGDWWWAASGSGGQFNATHWGIAEDIPAPADYDGDGKTDLAVYRPSVGGWYVFRSASQQAYIVGFGLSADKPAPADFDGDGNADITVYRPSNGNWYFLLSTSGYLQSPFGISTDIPVPNSLVP